MLRIKRVGDLPTALVIVSAFRDTSPPVTVDFSEIDFVTPAPALLLASAFRNRQLTARINESAKGFGYASHVSFFDACGIQGVGKAIGEATGGPNYAPITRVSCAEVKRKSKELGVPIPQLLQSRGENLARILTRGANPKIMRAVAYAMREILRNSVEHSGASDLWYAGQYWDGSHTVEVAVLDEGVGMKTSLLRNPENAGIENEEEAIRQALLPGVTGVPENKRKGEYANSGYGLYITRRICTEGSGSFAVVSNDTGLVAHSTYDSLLEGQFTGTIIQMRLDTSTLDEREDFAERLAREGEMEAAERTGQKRAASASSRSVSFPMPRCPDKEPT